MKAKASFTAIEAVAEILRPLSTAQQHRVLLAVAVTLGFDDLLRAFYSYSVAEPDDDEPEPDEPEPGG